MNFKTIEWKKDRVVMIDQRKLPLEETYVTCADYREVAEAIRVMIIRGAPAIGVAAAMGVALGALQIGTSETKLFFEELEVIAKTLLSSRPTAVNLRWAVDRMQRLAESSSNLPIPQIKEILKREAILMEEEDRAINRALGEAGQGLIQSGQVILTHCNAGALATAGWGTALGVLYSAKAAGKDFQVIADETRPFLQGARLTAWELMKNKIPVTLITDNMAASFMRSKKIHAVLVGADRIAANGDVANKIGTYGVAVLARHHDIPVYVAAPLSTVDLSCPSGDRIPIEERSPDEVTHVQHQPVAPEGVSVWNPAFDVTPHELVTAIVTEKGIVRAPYRENLKKIF